MGADLEATRLQNQLQHAPNVSVVVNDLDQGLAQFSPRKNEISF
jgi:inhibitor of KinA sporulation pathway (predicted exonuclease)